MLRSVKQPESAKAEDEVAPGATGRCSGDVRAQHLARRGHHLRVDRGGSRDIARLRSRRRPRPQSSGAPSMSLTRPPGLFDHDRASGVVPDVLDVAAAGDAQVDRGVATRHERVLRLAVQAEWGARDAQQLADARRVVLGRMRGLEQFGVARLARSGTGCDVERDGGRVARSSDSSQAPAPRSATNTLPIDPSARSSAGQPRTPAERPPSTTSASAMAYWPPRRKPSVPSTGSSVHQRPVGPPDEPPRSRASATVRTSRPGCASRETRQECRRGWAPTPAGEASSSPTSGSAGRARRTGQADHDLGSQVGHGHGRPVGLGGGQRPV